MKDRWVALSVLVSAASVALVVPPALGAAALVLPIAAVLVGPRLHLDRLAQVATTVAAMVAGVLTPRFLGQHLDYEGVGTLTERTTLLAFPVLGIASVRALIAAPRYGAPVTLAAALVALTAAGGARPGICYPLLAAAFLALGFVALARSDPGRAPPRRAGARHYVVTAIAITTALGLTLTATSTLPPLQDSAMQRLLQRFRRGRTGFSDRVALGALSGLLQDDRVVMRLRGEVLPPLLRGAALSEYKAGIWSVHRQLPVSEVVEVASEAPPGPEVIEIENARRPERYFLPLDARDVASSTGFFARNVLDIHQPIRGFEAKRVWFRTGGSRRGWEPTPADRATPRALTGELAPLLAEWGALEGGPRARLDRIEARLQVEYRYSLEFEREPGRDPLLDFLLRDRRGHCEYFAGSLALLGRVAGVPTRLVTGYRIAESNPWGYAVVRQRHAHAWVEAWLDGRWVTFDPTPPDALGAGEQSETPPLAAFFDRLATGWESVDDWLARRSPFELSLALVVALGVWLLYQGLRGRRQRAALTVRVEPPLPGFVALSRALARRGLERRTDETLAQFRTRIIGAEALGDNERSTVVTRLDAYSDLRYGGRGDTATVDANLAASARALQGPSVRSPPS
ncbi:MAG: DUF3488 domain-containing protein [Polyangiaceae bacterium]|nr:DUF3488 domain-containing protein [Polyangiaceae bacterium]